MLSSTPFILYALPRSRTAWLSHMLTYKDHYCHHEVSVQLRSIHEAKELLATPNIGLSDTALHYGHSLVRYYAPNIKEVVILRPVEQVIAAILKQDVSGIAKYDDKLLRRNMNYGWQNLQRIAQKPGVLVVHYDELHKEETCKAIFEHCLPYEFDREWWLSLKDKNIQIRFREFLEFYIKNRSEIDQFKIVCNRELRKLVRTGAVKSDRHGGAYAIN